MRSSNNSAKRQRHSVHTACRAFAAAALSVAAITASAQSAAAVQPLDSVIAVVNNQVILASDLDLEMRVALLLPGSGGAGVTPVQALDRLTTRALIEQQIVQEDPQGLHVGSGEAAANLAELRQNLPGCKRRDCKTPAGWSAYLATLGLTPERLTDYWARRMAVLAFIERRFRSGIRIAPEEIENYYRETLLPQYPSPADAPPLDRVSQRIQEVLLQQQVNALLNDWLKSLQAQGEVEILDPSLATSAEQGCAGKGGAQ